MSTEDATVQISAAPRPSTILWLGIAAAGGGASWLVTLVTMFANGPTQGQLIAAGLCASVTISVSAVGAWVRYSLAKAAGTHHLQLSLLLAGQHALSMADARATRRSIEEAAGQACAQRQALGIKLTKIIEDMPTYWHGTADTLQQWAEAEDNVRAIGRPRGPRS